MTITVADPSGSTVDFPDGTDAAVIHDVMAKHFGAGESAIGNNRASTIAALRGIPVGGPYADKVTAALNAAAQPWTETGLSHAPTFGERMTENEAKIKAATDAFEHENPIGTTVGKVALGTAATLPLMAAAPAAFGLTGTLPQMVGRGALSNAALAGTDAAVRGENPLTAAAIGGTVGAVAPLAARGVGALVRGIKDYRNPPALVPQFTEEVAGVKIPLSEGRATADPAKQAQEEIYRQGAGGGEAEKIALASDRQAQQAISEATSNISKSMDPTGASATTAPQAAGGAVQTELAAKEQARQAAAQAEALRVQAEGESLARGLGKPPPVSTPINWDRNTVANGLPLFAQQKVIDVPVDAMESAFKAGNPNLYIEKPGAAVIAHANAGKPMSIPEISATNGRLVFTNGRNRFALAKQNGETTIPVAVDAGNEADVAALLQKHAVPPAAPVSALDAAEGTGAAVAARAAQAKAATKAAYQARDAVPGTFEESVPKGLAEDIRTRLNQGEDPIWVDPTNESTANKALKLIDQTLGDGSGLLKNAAAPVESSEMVAKRTAAQELADTMIAQGINPQKAQSSALAAHGITNAPPAKPVDLKTIDEARKRLSTMFGDAKAAAIRSGDRSDMRAMGKILHEFDNSISDALESGKFSGDAKLAKRLMDEARASHAEYRQTFTSRGPKDPIGRDIEKILGNYHDSAATPDQIMTLSYGPASDPGGGKAQQIAVRLKKILGDQSPEWGQYKQGLFAHVIGDESLSAAEKAARIDKFLTGRGRGLANVALEPAEKRALASYSTSLKGIEPAAKPTDRVGKALQRITGADGHPPATSNEVVDTLFSRSAKGDGLSTELAAYLKKNLSPESWSALKQGAFEHLVTTPEGAKDLTSAAIAKRLSAYLDGDLSKVLNTPEELAEMRKLMLVHNKLTPLPGTVNTSGSAFFGQKMLKGAGKNLMTMLGFAHGGVGGAVVGHGLDAIGGMVKDARAGKQATRLFFGKQARSPIVQSRIPQMLAPTVSQRAQGGAQ